MGGAEASLLGKQPMEAGDADVVESFDAIPHDFRRDHRFFGNREIGGTRGNDENRAAALREGRRTQCNGSRLFVK